MSDEETVERVKLGRRIQAYRVLHDDDSVIHETGDLRPHKDDHTPAGKEIDE
jgi:hypothetical protein